jgi:PIN domain nuclease of toxin-antitoxin system
MSQYILDASALLALLNDEKGGEQVEEAIALGAAISTVNVAEVVSKLSNDGIPETTISQMLGLPGLEIVDFNRLLAHQTGMLRPLTKQMGLSLGDRACLALARMCNLPVLTTDRVWKDLSLDIIVRVIR